MVETAAAAPCSCKCIHSKLNPTHYLNHEHFQIRLAEESLLISGMDVSATPPSSRWISLPLSFKIPTWNGNQILLNCILCSNRKEKRKTTIHNTQYTAVWSVTLHNSIVPSSSIITLMSTYITVHRHSLTTYTTSLHVLRLLKITRDQKVNCIIHKQFIPL